MTPGGPGLLCLALCAFHAESPAQSPLPAASLGRPRPVSPTSATQPPGWPAALALPRNAEFWDHVGTFCLKDGQKEQVVTLYIAESNTVWRRTAARRAGIDPQL